MISIIIFSYLFTISLLLWLCRFRKSIAVFMVPFLIWYSIVLWVGINSLLGYPSESMIPENSIVKSIHINEPRGGYSGSMCFWMILPEKYGKPDAEPKAYKMPYDKELHKQLMKSSGQKNSLIVWSLLKGKRRGILRKITGDKNIPSKEGEFKVLNPSELLTKDSITVGSNKQCEGVCQ